MARQSQIGVGVLGLAGAGLCGLVASSWYAVMAERLALLHMGTAVYRRAQWASTVSVAAFATVAASLSVWLLAFSLRGALGLPAGARAPGRPGLKFLRLVLAAVAVPCLAIASYDEFFVRHLRGAPYVALGSAVALWLLLGYDVPRLARRAWEALRSRAQLVRVPRYRLDGLPPSGRVRTQGTIVADPAQGLDEWVYWHEIDPLTGSEGPPRVRPFWIEAHGARVRVEAHAGRLAVAAEERPSGEVILRPGDAIDVIGEVTGGGAGGAAVYREAPCSIGAGRGVLTLLGYAHRMHRRLLATAAIELLAALGFVAGLAALAGVWIYVGLAAR